MLFLLVEGEATLTPLLSCKAVEEFWSIATPSVFIHYITLAGKILRYCLTNEHKLNILLSKIADLSSVKPPFSERTPLGKSVIFSIYFSSYTRVNGFPFIRECLFNREYRLLSQFFLLCS